MMGMMKRNPEIKFTQLFINNEFIDAELGHTFPVINPTTEDTICTVSEASEEDVNKAVLAARRAFSNTSTWRTMDASERAKLIYKLCELMERDQQYLASLDTLDNGKPYTESLGDVEYSIKTLRYYAGWCDKIHGQTVPCDGDYMCLTRREPVGVVGQIIPWNYPVMMLAWKWGPALATGCTIILKPAELTPISSLYIGALVKEAGFPPGVINIVPGMGEIAGHAISKHPDIDKVSRMQMERILGYIEKGKNEGATLECGGERIGNQGYFIQPTVFSNVTDDMTIAKEEIFGPVQVILRFSTMDEVIERSNKTEYGLASGIVTTDINKALTFAQTIHAGSVWVNCYDVCLPQTPFGGYKQSGQGRELGEEGLTEYLEMKTIVIKVPSKL